MFTSRIPELLVFSGPKLNVRKSIERCDLAYSIARQALRLHNAKAWPMMETMLRQLLECYSEIAIQIDAPNCNVGREIRIKLEAVENLMIAIGSEDVLKEMLEILPID